MAKRMRNIKRFGSLVLSAIVAIIAVVVTIPAEKTHAATYAPLTTGAVIKDWDFKSGIPFDKVGVEGKIVKVSDDTTYGSLITNPLTSIKGQRVKLGDGLIVKFQQCYTSYDGELFDIYIRLTPGPSLTSDPELEFVNGDNGGVIKKDSANTQTYIAFSTGVENAGLGGSGTDFDYEIWLRHNNETGAAADTATTWDSAPSTIDQNEMFIGGSCYMSGVGTASSYEAARPWSSDGVLYANDNVDDPNNEHHWSYSTYVYAGDSQTYSAWVSDSETQTDAAHKFVIGYGYTDSHSIKGGYSNKVINRGSGIAEMLLGYRVRNIIFRVYPGDTGFNTPALEVTDKYLENSVVNRGTPQHAGKYIPEDTDFVPDLAAGATFKFWTTAQDIVLDDGSNTIIYAGQVISEEQMAKVKVEGTITKPELIFYAHSDQLPYTPPASPTPIVTPVPTTTPSSDPVVAGGPIKVEFVTPIGITPDTQIKNVGDKADDPGAPKDPSSLEPGTVIGGYRFEGWFLDQGFTLPYNFDTQLQHSIILYAKWVRVSPKTGDTGIPNMLYILGIIALAGAGFVTIKAKKSNR